MKVHQKIVREYHMFHIFIYVQESSTRIIGYTFST